MSELNQTITHSTENKTFSLTVNGRTSYLSYDRFDHILDIYSTYVDKADRGKGIAQALVLKALEYAKENNLKVKPTCSYVSTFLKRNPDWETLR